MSDCMKEKSLQCEDGACMRERKTVQCKDGDGSGCLCFSIGEQERAVWIVCFSASWLSVWFGERKLLCESFCEGLVSFLKLQLHSKHWSHF